MKWYVITHPPDKVFKMLTTNTPAAGSEGSVESSGWTSERRHDYYEFVHTSNRSYRNVSRTGMLRSDHERMRQLYSHT